MSQDTKAYIWLAVSVLSAMVAGWSFHDVVTHLQLVVR